MSISNNRTVTITEYGAMTRGKTGLPGYTPLPPKCFDALESLILSNRNTDETELIELLSLSARRSVGKIITAKNYVGLITTHDGTVIEILPKISGDVGIPETRKIFLDMLRSLKSVSFKEFNLSSLRIERMNLLEVFIKMFANEAKTLVQQGLKSNYNPHENNERFLKGKLLVAENLKYNSITRERFFVVYDEFSLNRPENRLIKTTLRFLYAQSRDEGNRRAIALLMPHFDSIDVSTNTASDFTKCVNDRSMSHYRMVMRWCRVFLLGNSFTAFAGREVAFALLFPMEKVFESYIAAKLKKALAGSMVEIRTQDSRYHLFDSPRKAFSLHPDMVLRKGQKTIVMDTKWKMLNNTASNSGISQSDMYQMYAYGRKYGAEVVKLIYPAASQSISGVKEYSSDDGVRVKLEFVDLRNPTNDIIRLSSL